MRRYASALTCLLVAAGWATPGCFEKETQRPTRKGWWDQDDPAPKAHHQPQPAPDPKPNPLAALFGGSDTSGAAKDGNYTILLTICRSPGSHVDQAKYYKQATEKHAGWDNLFIIHKESHSLLYWGQYKKIDDARPNLKRAKDYRTPANVRLYVKAIIVPLPGKDDIGPDEWRLDNVPAKYVYTVLVAEFHDVPEADYVGRRKFAVDYCRQLRQKSIEAYYKHDPASSIVTIGLFERSAVMLIKKDKKTQRQVRDARIKSIFARFPNLAVNGREKLLRTINVKTRKIQKIPAPTYLMVIPREKASYEATVRPRAGDRPGHPKPGQAAGDSPGAGAPAGTGGGTGGLPEGPRAR